MNIIVIVTTKEVNKMEKQNTIGMFHTPESMEELENWIAATKDPKVITAAMMMHNLWVTKWNQQADIINA